MNAVALAELLGHAFGKVIANDAARSSFTVTAGKRLLAVDGANLSVVHAWPLEVGAPGWHASLPDEGLALVSGSDRVALLEAGGSPRWSFTHAPWGGVASSGIESGCAWFDTYRRPFAVVPAPDYNGCTIVQLDISTGTPIVWVPIAAFPAGISPVHHPDGWVGLSEGEGQDAARTWWVQVSDGEPGRLNLLDAGWDDLVLADVHPKGDRVLTTPHASGPLTVRSFPGLEVKRAVQPPSDEDTWDFEACFVRDCVVARLLNDTERAVTVDPGGHVQELDCGPGMLVPASDSWLTVEPTRVRRWTLA